GAGAQRHHAVRMVGGARRAVALPDRRAGDRRVGGAARACARAPRRPGATLESSPRAAMRSRRSRAAMLTFQQLILKLQSYWDAQGCALLQPYDMEVGAGTSHTATFLRALGPEPWKAAYVQPSRRPKDGRYGENPNRLQHYYQYQVVLKPAPG